MDQQSFPFVHRRTAGASRSRFVSRLASLFAAGVAISGMALLAPACGDNSTGGSGGSPECDADSVLVDGECKKCDGVIVNGVCEGKCTADKCLENNVCVNNRCMLECDSHRDCDPAGGQDCTPAKNDETDADVNVCTFVARPAGMGVACPFGFECDGWRACPDNGICFTGQCGGDQAACMPDTEACKGVDNCVFGKCPDNTACRTDCFTACNTWLSCEGKGEADADAYCTKRDCMSDDECIGGYYCGIIRDPHEICGSSPKKGDNSFCGTTNEPCVALPEAATTRFEGSVCMLRKSCIKRNAGAPCKTDLDCSQFDGLACVTYAGEQRCAAKCLADSDCAKDASCDPAVGACVPRFGAWKGAPGTFCAPCQTDEDCGTAGTFWACSDLSNGMKACFDQSFPDTCTTDADCPASPSGKHGSCLDEDFGLGAGDPQYHHCYLPVNLNTNKTSCW